jgi:hypothetical protein
MNEDNEVRPSVQEPSAIDADEIKRHMSEECHERVSPRIPNSWSVGDLIRFANERPPEPIIDGLLYVGDILVLHGTEESFKSIFVVQIAESVATCRPLLRRWRVQHARRVGIVETEMHPAMLGERLARMFPNGTAPEDIRFMGEEILRDWRRQNMPGKFQILEKWITVERIEVLVIDTANDFFRGNDNPSAEMT